MSAPIPCYKTAAQEWTLPGGGLFCLEVPAIGTGAAPVYQKGSMLLDLAAL